jgi:hypothetical protein
MLAGIRQDPKADVPKDLADVVATFKAQFKTSVAAGGSPDGSAQPVGDATTAKTLATE